MLSTASSQLAIEPREWRECEVGLATIFFSQLVLITRGGPQDEGGQGKHRAAMTDHTKASEKGRVPPEPCHEQAYYSHERWLLSSWRRQTTPARRR
jgi:hypothetical protein